MAWHSVPLTWALRTPTLNSATRALGRWGGMQGHGMAFSSPYLGVEDSDVEFSH